MKRLVMSEMACLIVVFVITLLVCLTPMMEGRSNIQQTVIAASAVAVGSVIAALTSCTLIGCGGGYAAMIEAVAIIAAALAATYGGAVMAGVAVERNVAAVIVVTVAIVASVAAVAVVGPVKAKKTAVITSFVVTAVTALILAEIPTLI